MDYSFDRMNSEVRQHLLSEFRGKEIRVCWRSDTYFGYTIAKVALADRSRTKSGRAAYPLRLDDTLDALYRARSSLFSHPVQ